MGLVDQAIGSLLIGSWINTCLWAWEIILVYLYFRKWRNDYFVLRLAVVVVAITDTFSTISAHVGVYTYTISHWGQTEYIATQIWSIPVYLICVAITSIIVQSYLCQRYLQLSQNKIVTTILVVLMFVQFGANIAVCVGVIQNSALKDRPSIVKQVIIWFCTKAATDISICGALIWYLIQRRRRVVTDDNRSLFVQVTSHAIETGLATSAAALAAFVVFVNDNDTNVSTAIGQTLGRLYTLCLMYNLLYRKLILVDDPFHQATPSQSQTSKKPSTIEEVVGGGPKKQSRITQPDLYYSVDLQHKQLEDVAEEVDLESKSETKKKGLPQDISMDSV